jgi:hypothetical protein
MFHSRVMGKKIFTNIVWMLTTGVSCALGAAVYWVILDQRAFVRYCRHFRSVIIIWGSMFTQAKNTFWLSDILKFFSECMMGMFVIWSKKLLFLLTIGNLRLLSLQDNILVYDKYIKIIYLWYQWMLWK